MKVCFAKIWRPPRQDIRFLEDWRKFGELQKLASFSNWGSQIFNATCWQIFSPKQTIKALVWPRAFDSNVGEAMMLFRWASEYERPLSPVQSLPSFIQCSSHLVFVYFATPSVVQRLVTISWDCFKRYSELVRDYTVFRCFVSEDHRGR